MKLVIARNDFLAQLQIVARATALRSAIQTLSGVLITAAGDRVTLAATDMEIAIRSWTRAEVQKEGSLILAGRLVLDILRALEGDKVALEQKGETGEVSLTSDKAAFTLRSLPVEDFPRLPEKPGEGAIAIPAKAFSETLARVVKAASRDETRPVLTGVLLSVEKEALRMVATDSYRLSVKETKLRDAPPQEFEANVPARALQELSRVVSDTNAAEVSSASHDNQIVFSVDQVVLSSRTIEGQFPNYQQLLPESYENEVKLNRAEFLAVVRRISLMAQRNAPLRLKFEQGSVAIAARTPDVGEASEVLPVNFEGEPLEIGFNPQFLQDGLESAESEDLTLKLISPLRPGLIEAARAGEEEDEQGRFLYLIMPVRLNV